MNTTPQTSLAAPVPAQRVIELMTPHHEAISARAYHLWVVRGRPENCDRAIWLEAEGQLIATQLSPQCNLALATDF